MVEGQDAKVKSYSFSDFRRKTAFAKKVGQAFAVTRERIRQIEAKALRKLRHPSRSRKLRAFLDGVRD